YAVQVPAWIERAGRIVPIRPGSLLLSNDVIRTGPGGRVHVDLPEGSRVKLGEQAELNLAQAENQTDDQGSFFRGVLNVLKGAFRFTTLAIGRDRRRSVDVSIGVLTAGIRGTDIWGRSKDDEDLLILIEGEIELGGPGREPFILSEPLNYVTTPKAGPLSELMQMPLDDLAAYARETELDPGGGVLTPEGAWSVVLMSVQNRANGESVLEQLQNAGYPVELIQTDIAGVPWYRLSLRGFLNYEDARHFVESISTQYGIETPWIKQD
ncbi:MAG: FecR domain-containing protein, partial [Gammaproteobacteria bacterium]|nr:FecR domain-containing protein [Gammaproteobacteria bacterium]